VKIDNLLQQLAKREGSDLHLKVGRPPLMRIHGELMPTDQPDLSEKELRAMILEIMPEKLAAQFDAEMEADFAYQLGDLARFRVNAFQQQGKMGSVMRLIPLKIPTIDTLNLPPILKDIALERQGLVLFTGPTGSGKSTSMASMIDYMNHRQWRHVVSVEDPVEFVYTDDRCTINQRELGIDTLNFDEALKRVLRQDPDVILMGEMRDYKTMEFALNAAETGHLVYSTLHTNDCKQTLDRILQGFARGNEQLIRMSLSQALLAIVSQRLLPRADGSGRIAAVEIMINTPYMSQLLHDGKMGDIESAMKAGKRFYGMQTYNYHLAELVTEELVKTEDALEYSPDAGNLKLILKGFASGAESADQVRIKREKEKAERDKRLAERRKKFSLKSTAEEEASGSPPAKPAAGKDKKTKLDRGFDY